MKSYGSRVLWLLAVLTLPSIAGAQADQSGNFSAPTTLYHGSAVDNVSVPRFVPHISIPLLHLKGRGIDLDINATFNNITWNTTEIDDPSQERLFITSPGVGGWGIGVARMGLIGYPDVVCYLSNANGCIRSIYYAPFFTAEGSVVKLPDDDGIHGTGPLPTGFWGNDGSYMRIRNASWFYDGLFQHFAAPKLTYKDGVSLNMNVVNHDTGFPISLEDTNGNKITCNGLDMPQLSSQTYTCTDTVGRVITFNHATGTSALTSITYVDTNGITQAITFTWQQFFLDVPWANTNDNTDPNCFGSAGATCYYIQQLNELGNISPLLLTDIALPNGLHYSFEYQQNANGTTTGQIAKIKLPTGGYVRYQNASLPYPSYATSPMPEPWDAVLSRTVSSDGTAGSEVTWSFSSGQFVQGQEIPATVTDPLGNMLSSYFSWDLSCPTIASRTDLKNSSGSLLKQVLNTVASDSSFYADPFVDGACSHQNNPRITASTTILSDTNQQSLTTFQYDAFGNTTEQYSYDYGPGGPGGLLQHTSHQYLHNANSASYGDAAAHILDRTTSTIIYDGAGTLAAQKTIGYDIPAPSATSNAVQHDYGSYSSANTARGNPTQINNWSNTTSAWLTTTTWYNDVGDITQTTDPKGNVTTFNYTDNFAIGSSAQPTFAYATQITRPVTNNGTSNVNHIERSQYYFNTGLLAASCGENFPAGTNCATGVQGGQPDYLAFTYDLLGRPLTKTNGDGSGTTLTFNEETLPITVGARTKRDTDTTHDITQTVVYDRLGRLSQTRLTSDPSGTTYTLTAYDSLGRMSQVFNPTRCNPPGTNCGEATWGYTSFAYDDLGRVTKTTSQDGGVVTTLFNGNATTVTDQAGKQRRSIRDGLGRLVEVDEPGGALSPGAQATASVTISGSFNSTWVAAGTPHLAATGTALASVTMADGSSHDFYFDTNQHLCQLWGSTSGGWATQDLTELTEAALPIAGSALSAVFQAGAIHVFYQGANQRIYDMNWTGSAWQNLDLTALAGATGASGTKISALVGGSNSPMAFYEGTNQHFYMVYWVASANVWSNADLNSVPGATTFMALNSSVSSAAFGSGLYGFYLGTNQDLITIYWSGSAWLTADITALSGAAPATTGSALTSFSPAGSSPLMNFYEGPSQHIYSIYWNSGTNTWQSTDFSTPNVAATSSALANNPAGPHAFYLNSIQHLYDANWNGSAWVNSDLTSLSSSTVVPAAGSSLSSHGTSGGNTSNIFFEGGNQHIYHTYYSPTAPGWFNEDPLATASNFVVDSGTVSLTIPNGTSNFTATVCYGVSTNPVCAGKPVNASPGDIANALAAVLNGAGSPVNATVTGTTLNFTWRTTGWNIETVAPMTSASDNPSLFPSGSFTSTSASFSGGADLGSQTLTNPLVTLYKYDALGNLTCVEQHGDAATGTGCSASPSSDATSPWRVRRFTYDSLSRLLTAKNPESGTITYLYNDDGELLQKTSPAPNQTGAATQTVSYCYDARHRVTGRGYGAQSCPLATPVVSYVYDSGANAKGHLTSMIDQAGTATYGYDILGRLATETRTLIGANNATISKNISYTYSLDGSVNTLTYPSNNVITYTHDSAGRTLSAIDSASGINYVTGATYGPDGALTGFISGNSGTFAGITNSFSYNKRLQPLTMSATTPSQTVYSIGYDFHAGNGAPGSGSDNGNVWGIFNYKDTTHGRDQSFTYDALNRLRSAQNAGTDCNVTILGGNKKFWGNTYGYDAWGNLLNKSVTKCSAEGLSVTADAQNRIHATGTPDYQYDSAGNMTFNATPPTQTYTYDQENRLTGAAGYTYTYDGDGNRVRKSNGSLAASGTLYWAMTPGVVAETDLAGTTKSEYVFFDGERVARRDGATGTGGVFYYFSDHLQTASVITDSAGVIKAESDYYPWGGELQFVNNDPNDYKFTGKKNDLETGLYYFGARYYSNGLGRWVSADWSPTPIPVPYADFGDPQTLNLYGYVGGNPASKADPDGHDAIFGHEEDCLGQRMCQTNKSGGQSQSNDPTWKVVKEGTQVAGDVATGAAKEVVNEARDLTVLPTKLWNKAAGIDLEMDIFGPALEASNSTQRIAMTGTAILLLAVPGAGEEAGAVRVVRAISKGEKVPALLNEIKALTWSSGGIEHAIVTMKNGDRLIVAGNQVGINFGSMTDKLRRIIVHTHPGVTGPSAADVSAIKALGQRSSRLIEFFGGGMSKFYSWIKGK